MTSATSAFWSRPASELMAELGSSGAGLSSKVAANRLQTIGANVVSERQDLGALKLFLTQFRSPLVLILVFGAFVSLFLGDMVDASIILLIILGSTLLGFTQEYRASSAIAELRDRLALTARVIRDGRPQTVPARDIVPGDILLLSAGNLVPADGLILEAKDFLVTEASLTGESFPVEKQPGRVAADAPLSARTNSVFLGTSVRSGTATVLAAVTGRATALGGISAHLRAPPPESEFARGIRQFGYLLIRVMVLMVVFVLTINQVLGRPVIDSLLFAMALAVGLSPELLPAIVSVTLSAGARAMARRGVIVRRLEAIENLGSMDILCTDKTGTLTIGTVALSAAVDVDGQPTVAVQQLAYLNAAFESGIENPLDAAIVAAGERDGLSSAGVEKIDEIPYDFIRKRLTIVVARPEESGHHHIITKGAFSNVLDLCSSVTRGDKEVALTGADRDALQRFFRQKGVEGYRVLALAHKKVAAQPRYGHDDERAMSLAGLLLFFDPPKAQASQTIADLARLGIRMKVISGDNRYVTAHLAQAIGLDAKAMLTGEEIGRLKDEALWQRVESTDLFVEVDPQQKERIVRALQRRGHAVGYLGDGINDAPALHAADVGISVGEAVDVARESAEIILLQPDLDVLRQGVEDGRRTFTNTTKYIRITTSANFGNMVSMAIATTFLPFLPLTAKQILLNNFLSDLPSIAISTDRIDPEKLTEAQRWQVSGVRAFMLMFGLISSVFDLVTFLVLLHWFQAGEHIFQTAWFVVSLLTELAVVLVLRTERAALLSRPGPLLLGATIIVGLLAVALPFAGPLATVFGFVSLPGTLLATLLTIVAGYVVVTELVKQRFFRAAGERAPLHRVKS